MESVPQTLSTSFITNVYKPACELINTEKTYVASLKFIAEKYIPLKTEPLPGLVIPKTLEDSWHILWANWVRLFEWHSVLLQRMQDAVKEDIHSLANVFIDAEKRLASYYSTYCENYRRANFIAEQHKEFFLEVKRLLEDEQELQSYLIKPVQRITRYKLPIEVIVIYAERMDLPSLPQWKEAARILKKLPADTQMIFEASKIENYKGNVLALGKIRIRGPLRVGVHTSRHSSNVKLFSSLLDKTDQWSFQERYLFLFDQRLIITEEIKPKRTTAYSNSTFFYIDSIPTSKLHFEEWLPSNGKIFSRMKKKKHEEDGLKFTIRDSSYGDDSAYIIDPGCRENRDSWIGHLRDLKEEQRKLLGALLLPQSAETNRSMNRRSFTPIHDFPL